MINEELAIGIDLGTTNSCAAVYLNDNVQMIHGDDGNPIMASLVFFEENGERLVGNLAKDRLYKNFENGIYGVKRFIGRTYEDFKSRKELSKFPYLVENDNGTLNIVVNCNEEKIPYAPEEISAMVLSKLKQRAEEVLGKKVSKAVITVPAHFNGRQRQATIDAGRIAGLTVLRIINEPTAAILAYELQKKSKKCNVLVYDFGGGTFDVTIATIDNGNIDIKASNGEQFLGGDDLNDNLTEYLIDYFLKKTKVDLGKSKVQLERLKQRVEKAKIMLSTVFEYELILDYVDVSDIDFEYKIKRSFFLNINEDLFEKTLKCIDKTLEEAHMKKEDIDEILLVGGSTRIPHVRTIVQDYFKKEPNCSIHPDEVVAKGAAIQAAIVVGNSYSNDLASLKLTDICSLSLGTDIKGDLMRVLIPRNTKLPTKKTKGFQTSVDNQIGIGIGVYEGERPMVNDNILLSEFELEGIRLAPRGEVKTDITFEIDESGILKVTAVEVGTNNSSSLTVSIYKNNLSENQIKGMIENAERFKEEDEKKKSTALLKNSLDDKCYKYRKEALQIKNISMQDKKLVLDICEETLEWLQSNNLDKIDVERKIVEVENKCETVINKYCTLSK